MIHNKCLSKNKIIHIHARLYTNIIICWYSISIARRSRVHPFHNTLAHPAQPTTTTTTAKAAAITINLIQTIFVNMWTPSTFLFRSRRLRSITVRICPTMITKISPHPLQQQPSNYTYKYTRKYEKYSSLSPSLCFGYITAAAPVYIMPEWRWSVIKTYCCQHAIIA